MRRDRDRYKACSVSYLTLVVLPFVEVIEVSVETGWLDVIGVMQTFELRVHDLLNLGHVPSVVHRRGAVQEQSPAC